MKIKDIIDLVSDDTRIIICDMEDVQMLVCEPWLLREKDEMFKEDIIDVSAVDNAIVFTLNFNK